MGLIFCSQGTQCKAGLSEENITGKIKLRKAGKRNNTNRFFSFLGFYFILKVKSPIACEHILTYFCSSSNLCWKAQWSVLVFYIKQQLGTEVLRFLETKDEVSRYCSLKIKQYSLCSPPQISDLYLNGHHY